MTTERAICWVSVEERLPNPVSAYPSNSYDHDIYLYVLIYNHACDRVSVGFYRDPVWYEGIDDKHPFRVGSQLEPTHWALMPEPPDG